MNKLAHQAPFVGLSPTTRDKVEFLRSPEAWPNQAARVEVVETHMSWVFLGDREVYKLKKPVRYSFLDFSTLAARQHFCEEEVRLNRRLAAPIYLGVRSLTVRDGRLAIGEEGEAADWLVHMRRLPAGRMLDRLLEQRAISPPDFEPVARRLVAFHAQAEWKPMLAAQYRAGFAEGVAELQRELSRREFGLYIPAVDAAVARLRDFLNSYGDLLGARAPWLVEGHGDLRPEHICVSDPPLVIDCLEFNPSLRRLDPLDELAFLAMEARRLGGGFVTDVLLNAYRKETGEVVPSPLWAFYGCYRALLRAKLTIWHLEDDEVSDPGKWRSRANDYLALACDPKALALPAGRGIRSDRNR